MDLQRPSPERRGARWLARAGAGVGCAIALGGGYAAAAGGLGSVTVFTDGLTTNGGPANPLAQQYDPLGIAPGSDGALWFSATITNANSMIGRITPNGTITKFMLGGQDALGAVTEGPEGNLWFADLWPTPSIGRITPDGTITEYPTGSSNWPQGIAAAPDGDIWFTEGSQIGRNNQIGKLTPNGELTQYTAGLAATSALGGIAPGHDGDMWFADAGFPAIGKITPDGTITEYTAGLSPSNSPTQIAQGPDGNMWFVDRGIGRITPSGQMTQFSLPVGGGAAQQIAAGPDGNMWFTIGGSRGVGEITPDGAVTEFGTAPDFVDQLGLATGSDGNLWVTGGSQTGSYVPAIARIGTGAPPASVAPPTVTGSAQEGDVQSCAGATWSAWAGQQPSLTASTVDGYQWLLDGSALAGDTAQSYTPASSDLGHQLSCTVTATYTLSSVTVSASSAPVTILPAGTTTSGGGTSGGGGTTTTTTTTTTTVATPATPGPTGTTTTTAPASASRPAPGTTGSSKTAAKLSIVGIATVHLDTRSPKLHVTLKASKACQGVLVLLAPTGKVLARWTVHLTAGTHKLTLVLPAKARHAGRYRLRLQTGAAKPATVTVSVRA